MKQRLFFTFLIALNIFLSLPIRAAGDFGLTDAGAGAGYKQSNVYAIANTVVSVALSLLAIIFLAVMLYAGLRWMTARGNDELTEKAKNAMRAGIIGLIVVVISYALVFFVFSKFGV